MNFECSVAFIFSKSDWMFPNTDPVDNMSLVACCYHLLGITSKTEGPPATSMYEYCVQYLYCRILRISSVSLCVAGILLETLGIPGNQHRPHPHLARVSLWPAAWSPPLEEWPLAASSSAAAAPWVPQPAGHSPPCPSASWLVPWADPAVPWFVPWLVPWAGIVLHHRNHCPYPSFLATACGDGGLRRNKRSKTTLNLQQIKCYFLCLSAVFSNIVTDMSCHVPLANSSHRNLLGCVGGRNSYMKLLDESI